jgi:hypothetical protein
MSVASTIAADDTCVWEGSLVVNERAKIGQIRFHGDEEIIYQTKNRSNQDPLNFMIRLNNYICTYIG